MEYDLIWSVIGLILMITGIIGCIVPVIPGPGLSWLALLILQLHKTPPFSAEFIVTWGLITAAVTLLDYYVPLWGTKKFGGTHYGTWGSAIGIIAGLFLFPPLGIIIFPFLGALTGELIGGKESRQAMRSAWGSFLGFLAGTIMKLITSLIMGYYFITHAFNI